MDELVKMVAQKAGITEAQAKTAVDTVMSEVQKKLPEPYATQMKSMMSGGGADVMGAVGGMFGKR